MHDSWTLIIGDTRYDVLHIFSGRLKRIVLRTGVNDIHTCGHVPNCKRDRMTTRVHLFIYSYTVEYDSIGAYFTTTTTVYWYVLISIVALIVHDIDRWYYYCCSNE